MTFETKNAGWVASYLGVATIVGGLVGLICGVYGMLFEGVKVIFTYGIFSFEAFISYVFMIFLTVPVVFATTIMFAIPPFVMLLFVLYFSKWYRSFKGN